MIGQVLRELNMALIYYGVLLFYNKKYFLPMTRKITSTLHTKLSRLPLENFYNRAGTRCTKH